MQATRDDVTVAFDSNTAPCQGQRFQQSADSRLGRTFLRFAVNGQFHDEIWGLERAKGIEPSS